MSAGTMEYIKDRYMGLADDLLMIYVPMHIGSHWYLMIVDIWEKKLMYLDSCKSDDAEETKRHKDQMREVAKYLGVLIRSRSFWKNKDAHPPLISEFDPEEATTGQMDCGVWVCQWMLNSHKWLDYDIEPIDASTRMRIATQLVLGPHNPLAASVTEKAVKFWNAEMVGNYKEEAAAGSVANGPRSSKRPSV
ncbi:hypothetical protein PIB30_021708 [Stylosanthes scabra]|uniref:Ubiquitin-like protease family profile domain-containing protein n=1 Tax=Stylosanthes scabra TaxID=79078 RepID=A0ABU6R977_9FABA|nr:hypothetical protein [Stylosanthes scabra]